MHPILPVYKHQHQQFFFLLMKVSELKVSMFCEYMWQLALHMSQSDDSNLYALTLDQFVNGVKFAQLHMFVE